ncbi:MAG: hypothetical protein ACI9KE_004586 [Polyangiales bacterium]
MSVSKSYEPLRFEDVLSGDFVEVRLAGGDDDDRAADLLILARVRTSGFTAEIDSWIIRGAWDAFCTELKQLEKTRQGKASLEAISPGELKLDVQSTNRAGHMAIGGLVGTDMGDSHVRMTFSPVPFDPTALPELVRTAHSWTDGPKRPKMKWNPPAKCGEWRGLSEEEKWAWLQSVRDHYFASATDSRSSNSSGRTFNIDGECIEDVPSFFCVMGEAVNGPGGYFGANLMAMNDALCGGFGLDAPSTIRWSHSEKSKLVLDSVALARNLKRDAKRERKRHARRELKRKPPDPDYAAYLAYNGELLERAEAGTRTMFEEIVESIEFRSRDVELRLLLLE